MTTIFDAPEDFATTALAGFSAIYRRHVRLVRGGVVRATKVPEGKVAVVIGGGSGHYPAFAGYVGPGLADAAVAGDVLNFGVAAERLRAEGIDVRIVPVTDDVASAPVESIAQRRGIAGDVIVFKIAGAAAEAGLPLDEVERIARHANARTVSFGVAFGGCTLPGAAGPLFTVPKGQMALGLGIHGEPGIREEKMVSASDLATLLTDRLLAERPTGAARVGALLNGLGATKYEELFVLWTEVSKRLEAAGLTVVDPECGEYVTSLDMQGCSLTLVWLDAELETHWTAACDTPVLRRGEAIVTEPATDVIVNEDATPSFAPASEDSKAVGACIANLISAIEALLTEKEEELGRLDTHAGDGDHGQGMRRGALAARQAADVAVSMGAGAASVLAAAGDAWADRAGGTSGAIWGLLLRCWSTALSDEAGIDDAAVVKGARLALDGVTRLGRARLGDKTLVDALVPFVETLEREFSTGKPLTEAWATAADAAKAAAEATASLVPKLGRARPLAEKSLGHPDPGAISLAMVAHVCTKFLAERG